MPTQLADLIDEYQIPVLSVHSPVSAGDRAGLVDRPVGQIRQFGRHGASGWAPRPSSFILHSCGSGRQRQSSLRQLPNSRNGRRSALRWRTCSRSRFAAPWSIATGRIGIRSRPGIAGSPLISRTPRPPAPTPLELAAMMGDRLGHLHLGDGSGSTKDEHLVPGRGESALCRNSGIVGAQRLSWIGCGRDFDPRGRPGGTRSRSGRGSVLCQAASGRGTLTSNRELSIGDAMRQRCAASERIRRHNGSSTSIAMLVQEGLRWAAPDLEPHPRPIGLHRDARHPGCRVVAVDPAAWVRRIDASAIPRWRPSGHTTRKAQEHGPANDSHADRRSRWRKGRRNGHLRTRRSDLRDRSEQEERHRTCVRHWVNSPVPLAVSVPADRRPPRKARPVDRLGSMPRRSGNGRRHRELRFRLAAGCRPRSSSSTRRPSD